MKFVRIIKQKKKKLEIQNYAICAEQKKNILNLDMESVCGQCEDEVTQVN